MFSWWLSAVLLESAAFDRPFVGHRRANDAGAARVNEISC
jgi:hypothetical protein